MSDPRSRWFNDDQIAAMDDAALPREDRERHIRRRIDSHDAAAAPPAHAPAEAPTMDVDNLRVLADDMSSERPVISRGAAVAILSGIVDRLSAGNSVPIVDSDATFLRSVANFLETLDPHSPDVLDSLEGFAARLRRLAAAPLSDVGASSEATDPRVAKLAVEMGAEGATTLDDLVWYHLAARSGRSTIDCQLAALLHERHLSARAPALGAGEQTLTVGEVDLLHSLARDLRDYVASGKLSPRAAYGYADDLSELAETRGPK